MSGPILITGARAPVAVDLARAFAAAGHEVHLADSVTPWAARWSRSARGRIHRLPPARQDFPAYAAALAAWVARHDPALIVPTCEEVFYVAAAAARGGFADRVFAPPLETLRTLHSKLLFPAFARSIGVAAPDTWPIRSLGDLDALGRAPGELVLKPEYSRFGTETLVRPGGGALRRFAPSPDRTWVAQNFVEGEEICLWSAARAGKIVASAAYRPAWRHRAAAAFAFERVDLPAAEAVAARVAEATGMTGHLSFDLIVTPEGEAVAIECNPRAVSGLHLFDCGPELARAMTGEGPPVRPAADLRYLAPAMVLLGPMAGGWRALARDWRRGADSLGRPGDRGPAFGALLDAARFALAGLANRHGPTGQTTVDIEWNGEALP
jgi:hypothetical protein